MLSSPFLLFSLLFIVSLRHARCAHLFNNTTSSDDETVANEEQIPSRVSTKEGNILGPELSSSSMLYLGMLDKGIRTYSLETTRVTPLIDSNSQPPDSFSNNGIAFDSISNVIYYFQRLKIYRANIDGSDVRAVHEAEPWHGSTTGLAFDWVAGNMYGVTDRGNVFVCRDTPSGLLHCKIIIKGKISARRIAVNPLEGTIYWTTVYALGCFIYRAEMDGTNAAPIIYRRVHFLEGIGIDYIHSRLYWAEWLPPKIQSADLNGDGQRDVVQLYDNDEQLHNDASLCAPSGIALHQDRIYWGCLNTGRIQSTNTTVPSVAEFYNSTEAISDLTFIPPDRPVLSRRTNDCEQQDCSGSICVLSQNSFRCLSETPAEA